MDITSKAGHSVLEMRASKQFTRHSEGSFLRLNDGSIFYAYSRFTESADDCAPSDIVGVWSYDEGETWTEPKILLKAADFNTHNIMSVSLMRMQNGDVGMFFGKRYLPNEGRQMLARSNDEGKTWYKFVTCTLTDRPGCYVLNNDRVIRTSTGRLVMPLAYHRGGDSWGGMTYHFDYAGSLCFLLSDDDGETWFESPDTVHPPFVSKHGLQEPGVVELENGVLWAYARTVVMFQYQCYSFDNGMHWTQAQPSRFTSPCSPLHIRRNPYDKSLVAVWNPIPCYNGRIPNERISSGRTPIVYAVSKDDGTTWTEPVVIEGREDCGYCYPSIFFTKDHCMLVGYCSGAPEDGDILASSSIRKIELN